MKVHLYVENKNRLTYDYLADVNFKNMVPLVNDEITFNNEIYKVVKREFNTYKSGNKFLKECKYESEDMNIYLMKLTNNYNK